MKDQELRVVLFKLFRSSGVGLDKLPATIQELESALDKRIRSLMSAFAVQLTTEMAKRGVLVVPAKDQAPAEGAAVLSPESPQKQADSEDSGGSR